MRIEATGFPPRAPFLTGRPGEPSSSEEVVVEVPDRLSTVTIAVDDDPEACSGKSPLFGDSRGQLKDLTDERCVAAGDVHDRGNVTTGYYQIMVRGLGGDVLDGDDVLVPVDDFRGHGTGDDPAEDAAFLHVLSFL